MTDAVALIPAAGDGSRLGQRKQFLTIDGVPLLVRAVRAAVRSPRVSGVVIAAPRGEEEKTRELLRVHGLASAVHDVVAGGAQRSDSVRAALAAVPSSARFVVIHDAARPFASAALFERVIAAAHETGAAIAALACNDTVKQVKPDDPRIAARTIDRRTLFLAQTPQCFDRARLQRAFEEVPDASTFTDEAALVEAAGGAVVLVPGESENFKVTDAADLERARAACERTVAVGFGYDVHAFAPGRRCVLGGVEFPGEIGLLGHSDADAPLHALIDAMLGAAGLGDLGAHFPDTDERFRGVDSMQLVREAVALLRAAGFDVRNVDLTIVAARPKIAPRREEMRARIAEALEVPLARVNVKATTTEGLGFIGRSEGIAAQAVALLGSSR